MDKWTAAEERGDELVAAAKAARENAYAPYSGFRVGAAVLTTSGRVYAGCNVENVSYGLTICAERVAISNAVVSGDTEIAAVAVVAEASEANDVVPCGACLQVMSEFGGTDSPLIISATMDSEIQIVSRLWASLTWPFKGFKPEGRS